MAVSIGAAESTFRQPFPKQHLDPKAALAAAANQFEQQFAAQSETPPEPGEHSYPDVNVNQSVKGNGSKDEANPENMYPQGVQRTDSVSPQPTIAKGSNYQFAALFPAFVNTSVKLVPPNPKTATVTAPTKPVSKQEKQETDLPAGESEPPECSLVSAPSAQQPLPSPASATPTPEMSISTKIGAADSQTSSASTGDAPLTHTAQQPSKENIDNIAFAVKLGNDSVTPAATAGQDTATIQAATQLRATAATPETPAREQTAAPSGSPTVSVPQIDSEKTPALEKAEKPAETHSLTSDSPEQAVGPARFLRVHLSGEGSQQVELRMVEHSGSINVSVRATDPVLNRSLQDGIPELTNRLQSDRFHAEVWLPKSAETHSANSGDSYSSSGRGTSGGEGNPHQPGSRKNQSRPGWVDELEQLGKSSNGRKPN